MIAGRCTRTTNTGAAWYIVFSEAAGEGSALLPYRFLGVFSGKIGAGAVEALEVVRSGAERRGMEAERRRIGGLHLAKWRIFTIERTDPAGIMSKSPPFWR